MKKLSYAAAAAAIVLSSSARAHELVCEKTVDGNLVREVTHYPAKLHFKVVVTNTHPTDASTALSVNDDLMKALGITFTPAAPFTLGVGQSTEFDFDVTVKDEAQCLQLAKAQACAASFEDRFEVDFDGGSAQCAARVICKPEAGNDNGGAVCKYDSDCPAHNHCLYGRCEQDDDHDRDHHGDGDHDKDHDEDHDKDHHDKDHDRDHDKDHDKDHGDVYGGDR